MGVGEQQRGVVAEVGGLVAAPARDAVDEAVFTQSSQVVADRCGFDVAGGAAEQGRELGAQVTVGEAVNDEPEHQQGVQQGMNAGIAESQRRGAGAVVGDDGLGDRGEDFGARDGVVANALDVEQTPGGGEAELPQVGQS